jgi:hypothetical protein
MTPLRIFHNLSPPLARAFIPLFRRESIIFPFFSSRLAGERIPSRLDRVRRKKNSAEYDETFINFNFMYHLPFLLAIFMRRKEFYGTPREKYEPQFIRVLCLLLIDHLKANEIPAHEFCGKMQ